MIAFLQEMTTASQVRTSPPKAQTAPDKSPPATYEIGFESPLKASRAFARKRAASNVPADRATRQQGCRIRLWTAPNAFRYGALMPSQRRQANKAFRCEQP
jgi:hypothetical protein